MNQQAVDHEKRVIEIENKALESQNNLKLQLDKVQKERDEKKMQIVDFQR